MKTFTKESLRAELEKIANNGWLPSTRGRNDGAVGNTLEDLLGISENNLPLPNAAEWELKAQRSDSTSLVTLCHLEPSPRALRFVPSVLLPSYGWPHSEAGAKYSVDERSFRQTIHAASRSDRGFGIEVDIDQEKLCVSWSSSDVAIRHAEWKRSVLASVGGGDLDPAPYWSFSDLQSKMSSKLHNCFFVVAHRKRIDGHEHFWFYEAWMLRRFDFALFVALLREGRAFIDFDARTGHNHGTKFRVKRSEIINLYSEKVKLFSLG